MKPLNKKILVDLGTPDSAKRLLRSFFRITERWGLSVDQEIRILAVNSSTCASWRRGVFSGGLDMATLARLSYVFRIFAALNILLPIPERADSWLTAPNGGPLFVGGTALQLMLGSIEGLVSVAEYLDAQIGADFLDSESHWAY